MHQWTAPAINCKTFRNVKWRILTIWRKHGADFNFYLSLFCRVYTRYVVYRYIWSKLLFSNYKRLRMLFHVTKNVEYVSAHRQTFQNKCKENGTGGGGGRGKKKKPHKRHPVNRASGLGKINAIVLLKAALRIMLESSAWVRTYTPLNPRRLKRKWIEEVQFSKVLSSVWQSIRTLVWGDTPWEIFYVKHVP